MRRQSVIYITLVLAVVVNIFLAATLVRVENQRYALQLGMCRDATTSLTDFNCLEKIQTRINWLGHLFYALKD